MARFSFGVLLFFAAAVLGLPQEAKLAAAQVPSAVRSAAKQRFPRAKLGNWSKEIEDGKTTFEVALAEGAERRDAVFSPDGALVSVETSIGVGQIPGPVKSAIQAKYPRARISKAEKITLASNEVEYEVGLLYAAKKEVLVSADGNILKEE